jgi:hypothetical protein
MVIPHSYIGIQPAKTSTKLDHGARATGIHHVAIWAKSRREIDLFYKEFLLKNTLKVTDPGRNTQFMPQVTTGSSSMIH